MVATSSDEWQVTGGVGHGAQGARHEPRRRMPLDNVSNCARRQEEEWKCAANGKHV